VDYLPLSGVWDFRLDGAAGWRPLAVPGCWEQINVRKDFSGPAWYRTRCTVPPEWAGRRLWLRFGAVGYHCAIFVNGEAAGEHTGMWDAFAVEITGLVEPGATAEILVRVEKPAGLQAGPDSAGLPGRFPLRETLSGFLPYVWGHSFGGIWQDVELAATGPAFFGDVHLRGTPDGQVVVEAELHGQGKVTIEILDPDGQIVRVASCQNSAVESLELVLTSPCSILNSHFSIPNPQPWSPATPALYTARLRVIDGDERVVRFGLRALEADGTTLRLNGRPIYIRLALSWGWYPASLHSNPGREDVRADLLRLKALGYNGLKLCLWFPPPYYFELADELGMLVWLELPMWLPRPTPFFRRQLPLEYERLVRAARNHPAVIIYTLGCELNRTIDAGILGPLFAMVKGLVGDALVRDNSGSGEAYGGLLDEHAEFYDYHFYSDMPFLRGLIDEFTPRWRPERPWLFGEFCDADTFRDLRRFRSFPIQPRRARKAPSDRIVLTLRGLHSQSVPTSESLGIRKDDTYSFLRDLLYLRALRGNNSTPWWAQNDPDNNPQGARWQYEIVHHEARLRANGMWERGGELEQLSERQALLYRKYILELVRLYREIGGYTVSGERDTPITSAGMWDDTGRLKFEPAEFRAFNADVLLLAAWGHRRAWIAGGDRAARWDTWSYSAGAPVRAHLVASHYGTATDRARVEWQVACTGDAAFARGAAETAFDLKPGDLREVAIAEWHAPEVAAPRAATLSAAIAIGDERTENRWPLWFFPRDPWRGLSGVALLDPGGRLADLRQIAAQIELLDHRPPAADDDLPASSLVTRHPAVIIATAWTPELAEFVESGGKAILLQSGHGPPGPLATLELPFWREAIRIAEPHPAWGDFPVGEVGMQFYGCAAEHALDIGAFEGAIAPILLRLDARTMLLSAYAAEIGVGRGRAIVTTLRFEGGAGDQPLGLARNTAANHLLSCWVRYFLLERM
jgi:hypothetical protein